MQIILSLTDSVPIDDCAAPFTVQRAVPTVDVVSYCRVEYGQIFTLFFPPLVKPLSVMMWPMKVVVMLPLTVELWPPPIDVIVTNGFSASQRGGGVDVGVGDGFGGQLMVTVAILLLSCPSFT